ncbi:multidrug and toxin extrusion protein 1-like [Gastrophryne carolinensis]
MSRDGGSNCKTFSEKLKNSFQENFSEFKILLWFTGPLVLTNFLDYVQVLIVTIFIGHVGKLQLDAVLLAVSFVSLFGISIGYGLNAACDTLISQAYGGKNLKFIGVIVQRAILILSLACFPFFAFCVNAENILILCGQDKDLARETELCVLVLIPGVPAIFFYQLQLRYLQNQGIFWPPVLTCFLACLVTALASYLFIFVVNLGVVGAALAMDAGNVFQCILLFLYINITKLHVSSWPGWSTECLKDWWSFLALGIPGIFLVNFEFLAYQIATLLAGLLNLVDLGGQSILCQLIILIQKVPFSLGLAASFRVGSFLGAGDSHQAKKSSKLSMAIAVIITLVIFVILIVLRTPISELLTNDKNIILAASEAMPFSALYFIFGSPALVFNGVLRGIGKPEIGASACAIGYCIIAIPLGAVFMFPVKLGIKGFWIGMITGFASVIVFFCIYYWRINWDIMMEKAQERACLKKNPMSSQPSIGSSEDKELANYASLSSSSSETELNEIELSKEDQKALKWLIIRRILEALAVFSTLPISLLIKFTIKLH